MTTNLEAALKRYVGNIDWDDASAIVSHKLRILNFVKSLTKLEMRQKLYYKMQWQDREDYIYRFEHFFKDKNELLKIMVSEQQNLVSRLNLDSLSQGYDDEYFLVCHRLETFRKTCDIKHCGDVQLEVESFVPRYIYYNALGEMDVLMNNTSEIIRRRAVVYLVNLMLLTPQSLKTISLHVLERQKYKDETWLSRIKHRYML